MARTPWQSDDLGPGSQVRAPDVAANAVNGVRRPRQQPHRRRSRAIGAAEGQDDNRLRPRQHRLRRLRQLVDQPDKALAGPDHRHCGVVPAGGHPAGKPGGECHISVNGFRIEPGATPGVTPDVTSPFNKQSMTLTNMTSPQNLGPGISDFGLVCIEYAGDMVFNPTQVSVVVLGSA